MNQSFLFFELIGVFIVHWLILEPQTYVVVEQFGEENIPLLSGRLVLQFSCGNIIVDSLKMRPDLVFLTMLRVTAEFRI